MSNSNPKNPPPKQPAAAKPGPQPAKPASAPAAPAPPAQPPGKVPPLYRSIDWWTFGLTSLLVFLGYLYTLAPDLTLQDCGELAVGSYYAGIPHPPGYPVWTIYSWLFTQFLPISNIAYRVAISSAVAAALACGLIGLMVSRGSSMMIEGISELKNVERRWENLICIVSGFVAGLLMGFNGFMWSQAVIVEVYTLSVLSLTGVLACLLRWIYAPHQYRYLYLAFFWYGICFNNHQSLLVIALGLEVAVAMASPKLGRCLFFWNVVIYLGGLAMLSMGYISMLRDNDAVRVIYNLIGVGSAVVWVVLVFKTRKSLLEFARDIALVCSVGYAVILLAHLTNYAAFFYYNKDLVSLNQPLFILFNLFGLGSIATLIYLIPRTTQFGREWRAALWCGLAWAAGAAFYLYMPIAGMTNPPLQWGYPRTVQGFFHAFTRGQYEKINPTRDFGRYLDQIVMYVEGVFEEFNLVYVLIAVILFFFYRRMQKREKAWSVGLFAIYITLSFFLLELLNPSPDRQSRDLNKPFFTASHVMIAMAIGYALTLISSLLAVNYAKYRRPVLIGFGVATCAAFFGAVWTFAQTPNPIMRYTAVFGVLLAAAGAVVLLVRPATAKPPLTGLAVLFALMPVYTIMSHWEENEQRGHYFGFWFGHDMFTPPFTDPKTGKLTYDPRLRAELLKTPQGRLIYPEMDPHTFLYGGTDPGRFNPTYMIFCESFIPASKRHDPLFDRRDVYLITQNALADGTYLNYIRAHYNKSDQVKYDTPFFSELMRGPREVELAQQGVPITNIIARLYMPVDRFFTELGDNVEKRRRAGSSFFRQSDFTDLTTLTGRLRPGNAQDAVSKFVFEHLSKPTQDLVAGGGDTNQLKRALAKDLNVLLEAELKDPKAEPLYSSNRFANVQLSRHVQLFVAQNPHLHTRIRLNRLLLEAAYPGCIAQSLGGVYPDREINIATPDDSQRCFQEYLNDAQRRLDHDRRFPNEQRQIKPGEDVRIVDNRVQVSGQVAVMSINGFISKVMFDKNPDHEFYVEESFPLEWMYPHLTPFGIIMKINREPVAEITQEMVDRDHEFWTKYSERLTGNIISYDTPISNICAFAEKVYYRRDYKDFKGAPEFVRDNDAQKAFSKLRSSIAGVYNYRIGAARSPEEQQRMIKEAEFAFKQAYAFCPYSPEALFRYVQLLASLSRTDDALLMAKTSILLDPHNGSIKDLIAQLGGMRSAAMTPPGVRPVPPAASLQAQIAQLEQARQTRPDDLPMAFQLASLYAQAQQGPKAILVADQVLKHPKVDANMVMALANLFVQLGQVGKVEESLQRLVQLLPDNPEAWFDLAGVQAAMNKQPEALQALTKSLQLSNQRLARDPNAKSLYSNALTDPRLTALRALPEFQRLLEQSKPPR